MAELRVKDLLEYSDSAEIKEVIAKNGECSEDEVKTGEIRMSASGLGTLWVQCPIKAANKIAKMRNIRVGWTNARVELLGPRALQCYRCLEKGHVQTQCASQIVRSSLCYRCGQEGHQVRTCTNKPHCAMCQQAGREASHKMGSVACKAPSKPGRRTRMGNSMPGATPTPQAERMDIEMDQPAVRGESSPVGNQTPVPVRSAGKETAEEIEVEKCHPPPLEKRNQRVTKGAEEPGTQLPSSRHT